MTLEKAYIYLPVRLKVIIKDDRYGSNFITASKNAWMWFASFICFRKEVTCCLIKTFMGYIK